MAAKRDSFAWAYERDDWLDSPEARDGLRYARRLAEMAREYRKTALKGEPPPFPLTPADIAFEEDLAEETVREWIALARFELYGNLSDSAIYARNARAKVLSQQPVRVCKAPDCEEPLPRRATKRREYHRSRCRRRHHYQLAQPEARRAPHLRGARERRLELTPDQLERVLDVIYSRQSSYEDDE
jgi:hypothetical protein